MRGREVRMDLEGVEAEKLLDGELLASMCSEAARLAGATVVNKTWANLGINDGSPPGCTVAVLLNESHITLHTYSDMGLVAVNVFTCGTKADCERALAFIAEFLGGRVSFKDSCVRFHSEVETPCST